MGMIPWFWLGLTAAALMVWLSRHLQITRIAGTMPPLHSEMYQDPPAAGSDDGRPPAVTLLVAAKDEAANIEDCLRSILRQDYPDFEIVVINDRSTDGTGEIIDRLAADHDRLTAVHVGGLRPGWFGKSHAMHVGVERATGEWFCFTDADCLFVSRRALAVAMCFARQRRADFLSVLPVHSTDSFWERVIQPACSGILMIWFNPAKVNDPATRTAYANGAFMLMRRGCYGAVGGHEAVKVEINEDMHLARRAKEAGRRLVVVSNEDLYTVRMYATVSQIWSGWTRIFFGCFGTTWRLALSTLVVTIFSLLPWAAVLTGALASWLYPGGGPAWQALTWTAVAAVLGQLSVMARFYAVNHVHPLYSLAYPLGAAVGCGALLNALWRHATGGTITWRGTTYRGDQVESTTAPPPSRD